MTVALRTCLCKSTGSDNPGHRRWFWPIDGCPTATSATFARCPVATRSVGSLARKSWEEWRFTKNGSGWVVALSWCCSRGVSEDSSCPDQVPTAAIQEPREDPCDLPATLRHALYFACNHSSAQIAGCRKVCQSLCEKIFASAVINIFQLHTGCDL